MAYGITVDFNANMVKLAQSVDSIETKLNQFTARAETGAQKLNSALSAIGVGLSAAGLVSFVKSGIDAADAMNDLADRSGIAIEKLAGLEYAVKIGDTNMESFVSASNKLSINISKNAEDFEKLGITAKDPVEAFKQLADQFSSIEDPQKRAALGAFALGKAYAEMAPLLMMGADGIQELIDKGREHNPVTAEQARLAGEFNDKLEEMANQSAGFRVKFSLGVLEPLARYAEELDKATAKSGIFLGALEGLANGFQRATLDQLGAGGGLSKELDDINVKIAEQKQLLSNLRTNESPGGAKREIAVYKELNDLLSEREAIVKRISDERSKPQASGKSAADAIDEINNKNNEAEASAKSAIAATESAAKSLQNAYDSAIKSLEKEIALRGENTAAANMEFEVQFGAFKALDDAQKVKLLNLAAEKDYVQTLIESYKEYDDIIEQGNQLAGRQRASMSADIERLTQMFSGENQAMYSQFDSAFQARGLGIIDDNQLARSLENISQGFDVVTGKAQESTDQMSEFAVQAARNMQTAFADFLFDPFEQGADGMLESFTNVIRRMAAEAASAQIMDGLFGAVGDKGQRDFAGGLIGTAFSAIGGLFGFADDGIMSSSGPVPLRKYASGGIANSPQLALFGEGRMNEAFVPLPDGRSIPVSLNGGGGGVTVNVINNANGTETTTRERQTAQGREIDVIIEQKVRKAMADEKRQGGMFAGMPA